MALSEPWTCSVQLCQVAEGTVSMATHLAQHPKLPYLPVTKATTHTCPSFWGASRGTKGPGMYWWGNEGPGLARYLSPHSCLPHGLMARALSTNPFYR